MHILAISGSARHQSTNTALLMALKAIAPPDVRIDVFAGVGDLPVFSPDHEGPKAPDAILSFKAAVSACDGILISSPEYIRSIPGGLKNAIDWLVSGDQVIGKPIALAHASHRGDAMLSALRIVLSTVSSGFVEQPFLRIPLMAQTPEQIRETLSVSPQRESAIQFLTQFVEICQRWIPEDVATLPRQ